MSTLHFGSTGEALAEQALTRAGYQIIERNWRGGGVELDRIAWHGDTLVFIEVRARHGDESGDPSETVRSVKQARVARGALAYLALLPGPMPDVRFDVVSVVERGKTWVSIIPDAFDASSLNGPWL